MKQQIVKRLLEKQGLTVEIVDNGKQAVNAFADYAAQIDAVLMHLRMPVMDGLSASKAIRALNIPEAKSPPHCDDRQCV